jgi:D-alanyl-D-alanine carboxypeptidase
MPLTRENFKKGLDNRIYVMYLINKITHEESATMKRKDAIKAAMKDANVTQEVLAEMLGYASQNSVASAIGRNISMDKFEEMMEALGFEIVIRRKRTSSLTGEYKIGGEE